MVFEGGVRWVEGCRLGRLPSVATSALCCGTHGLESDGCRLEGRLLGWWLGGEGL